MIFSLPALFMVIQLTQKDLDEFKAIWKKEYDKDLTDEEASEYAHNLIGLLEIVYRDI